MIKLHLVLLLMFLLLLPVHAEPMRGQLPEEQQKLIRLLSTHHEEIRRTVELTSDGYRSRTISKNPEVAAALLAHVRYMKKRLDSGGRVRNWDPAFRELTEHYADLITVIRELPDGLEIEVSGKTPSAVGVARNHARIVSGFVSAGRAAVERKHEPALQPTNP